MERKGGEEGGRGGLGWVSKKKREMGLGRFD